MSVEIKVPQAGESITEVQIGEWFKTVGDSVAVDEAVVELETDKASMEVPAPVAGKLSKVLKQAGDTARVGDVIAVIEPLLDAARAPAGAKPPARPVPETAAPVAPAKTAPAATAAEHPAAKSAAEPRVMPAARRALAEHGLGPGEVRPSGPGGRLLKEDVAAHVAGRGPAAPASADGAAHAPAEAAGGRHEEIVPMSMLRRRIAQRLVEAQHSGALLTTFNEIDMSAVLRLRAERGEAFEKKYDVKLGFMSFFVKAAVDALKRIPEVNAEVRLIDGAPHIVFRNFYDVGVAVSTDRGLVVPVIRNAERLSFAEIEVRIGDLARRARERKITVEELQGGTFTISNGGVFGSLMSTPIINPPQSGILGLHAIQDRPVALGGQVVIRPMMYVALTYDHRIIDGRESVTFLKRIKECVEDPTRMLLEI
ncbi:MAG: 2-oxoglutarate dehydrogenase complex dihydrolipoyllysine-residue succinyltransferase [Phycisphaerae bacterium]|jgi:2-oxoglutarate dehydrogenase E2 component (dihydrolipoamide succinyltransferase)|nr:2-oxoglutarate dehydrogenase complex dihydrolipoyllysine-residue succinyltransferase [Phycisphaerae bacterium]MCZ2401419.1 2-oxoglutarate dehydrogenase complex dihydrolipoyllysine-residue succinyltransferase [Phycisphaerae bacterium]